jgi:preprotein translocase subunit SecD
MLSSELNEIIDLGRLQAVELNGTVLTAPAIESSHFAGSAEISGTSSKPFTKAKAMEIAVQVRAASKMAPISR